MPNVQLPWRKTTLAIACQSKRRVQQRANCDAPPQAPAKSACQTRARQPHQAAATWTSRYRLSCGPAKAPTSSQLPCPPAAAVQLQPSARLRALAQALWQLLGSLQGRQGTDTGEEGVLESGVSRSMKPKRTAGPRPPLLAHPGPPTQLWTPPPARPLLPTQDTSVPNTSHQLSSPPPHTCSMISFLL